MSYLYVFSSGFRIRELTFNFYLIIIKLTSVLFFILFYFIFPPITFKVYF